jgi:hypothetical protein
LAQFLTSKSSYKGPVVKFSRIANFSETGKYQLAENKLAIGLTFLSAFFTSQLTKACSAI